MSTTMRAALFLVASLSSAVHAAEKGPPPYRGDARSMSTAAPRHAGVVAPQGFYKLHPAPLPTERVKGDHGPPLSPSRGAFDLLVTPANMRMRF